MIRKSNSLLKILFSSICLISGSAMAAPITDLSKQIVSEKPGSILSIAQQDETDLFLHADQRLLVNYRSRGVNGEPIVASAFILLPKGTPPKNGWPVL
ncbi:alpha/beta hydrolase, partial [Acinetobacter baumannii]|nr:alpha/beta hydrolase [Acinetobacter baumannii]